MIAVPVCAPVRQTITTSDGITFDPTDKVWYLTGISRTSTIIFHTVACRLTPSMADDFRYVLAATAGNCSGLTTHARFLSLRTLLAILPERSVDRIDLPEAMTWLAEAKIHRNARDALRTLRPLLKKWRILRPSSITDEAIKVLTATKLKANPVGIPVRTSDPTTGPFTDIELQAIIAALRQGFAEAHISIEEHALLWLLIATGARPVQIAAMRINDIIAKNDSVLARIPRAKQRHLKPRDDFKAYHLVDEIGQAVLIHAEQQRIRWIVTGLADIPLFGGPDTDELPTVSLAHHRRTTFIESAISAVASKLDITSERTGKPLCLTARRFRYTKGTRLAAMGASHIVIAEALDHTTAACASVYVEAVPAILQRIDSTLAAVLAPMAQAFVGQLAERDDASMPLVSTGVAAVGRCGTFGFCGALAPIACYTCRSFRPWLDGPHQEVLQALLMERERLMRETGNPLIAATNDRTILACAQVIELCVAQRGDHG